MGRRGSGKSTYLNHLSQKDNIVPIPIKIWEVIDIVESQVEAILKRQATIDSEKVADIWQLIFMSLACLKASELSIDDSKIKEFLKAFPIREISKGAIVKIVTSVIQQIKKVYLEKDEIFDIVVCVDSISSSLNTVDSLEMSLSISLSLSLSLLRNNRVLIFMLDNPERFTRDEILDLSQRSQDKPREQTIAGLLNLAGRMNKGNIGVQLRLCIPSEQYFYLKKVSQSKGKDFKKTQLLHWTSGEILSMVAHRYIAFLTVYPEYRNDNDYNKLLKIPIYTREGAKEFWKKIFPDKIKNGRGKSERALVYLLRHTQLLPRQLLDYLNKTINLAMEGGQTDFTKIDVLYLKRAIEDAEYETSAEVIDAYSYSYPEANEIFGTVLQKLPILTTAKDIKDIHYKGTDAKGILHKNSGHPQVSTTSQRFLRLLIETGVYGKVLHEPKENSIGYLEAEFEYTINGVLKIDDDDELAMHPLYSGGISPQLYSMIEKNTLGVYPVGTDLG